MGEVTGTSTGVIPVDSISIDGTCALVICI